MYLLAAVNWASGVESAWATIANFVPKFLGFVAILVVGYFVAKAVAKVLDKTLERVGFDRAVEKGGLRKMLAKSDYDASDIVSKLAYYTIMLFVLQAAFNVLGFSAVSSVLNSVIAYMPQVIAAVVIVVVTASIAAAVREVIDATLGGLSYGRTLANAAGAVIVGLGAFAALSQLNIAPAIVNGLFYAVIATVAGIAIVAVGGGGVKPMQQYWQNSLQKISEESVNIREHSANASERVNERAQQRREQLQANQDNVDVRGNEYGSSTGYQTSAPGRKPQGF